MKKYVLTGGPSVGKTTVIEILVSRGYAIVPEAARMIIEEKISTQPSEKDLKNFFSDRFALQASIAIRQLLMEEELGTVDEKIFLDRGVVDGVAYCLHDGVSIPTEIEKNGRNRYEKVFILESLGIYERDGVRGRTLEDAEKLHELIRQAYIDFGYLPVSVPVLSPEERVNFILSNI